MNDRRNEAAYYFLVALVVITPWPLGSRLPWLSMLFAAIVIAAAAVWFAVAMLRDRVVHTHALLMPIVAFLGWTGLQWLLELTTYQHATAIEWIRYLSYAAVFLLALNVASLRDYQLRLWRTIAVISVIVGIFALVQHFTWNDRLFWFYQPPYEGMRFGPFNNRNYFAGYMIATLGPAIALSATSGPTRRFAMMRYATALSCIAVLVSLSRAGAIALVAMILMIAAFTRATPDGGAHGMGASTAARRVTLAVGIIVVLLVGVTLLNQTDSVFGRLESIPSLEEQGSLQTRIARWREALPMVADRPVVGFGLNTFGWVFPEYRVEPRSSIVMHAHNEYLEMLIETGIVGAAICSWFVVLLISRGWRSLQGSRNDTERAIRLGALAGWTGILVYSLVDFPTIIPAIDYVLAVLAALAVTETVTADGAGGCPDTSES